jgi:hypothetical protein
VTRREIRFALAGLVPAALAVWLALGMSRGLLLSEDVKSKVWPWAPYFPRTEIAAPALSDPVWQFVPWIQLARRELLAGRLPLWNPHQSGGVPLLGNAQSALGSPLLWPALLFGVETGWNLSLLLRVLVALASAYVWLRDTGRSPAAALAGGAAFALSGPFIAWLEHPQTLTLAAIPLVLLFGRRLCRRTTRRDLLGLSLSVYVVASGGHPETLFMAAILAAAVLLAESHARPRALAPALAGALLGAGLAAPLLLPFVEYFRLSAARAGAGRRPFVLPASDLVRFVLPHRTGSNVIEAASTLSVAILVLAAIGLARIRRDPGVTLWAGVAAAILLVVYDNPVARGLALNTPVHWTRALLFLPLAAGYLGASALDALRDALARRGSATLALLAGPIAATAVAAELLFAARGVHGHSAPGDVSRTTPLLERLASDREPFRVLPLHTFLPPDSATAASLDDVRGYDALSPAPWRRQLEAMGRVERAPTQDEVLDPWGLTPNGHALDFWNVKYLLLHPQFRFGAPEMSARLGLDLEEVYSGPDGRILLNRRALPRARLSAPGEVTVVRRAAGAWIVRVRTEDAATLTVADPMFPGWRARLDGRTADLRSAPGEAMTVAVPAGVHDVELVYRPAAFAWGLAAAALSALLLAVARRRRPEPTRS